MDDGRLKRHETGFLQAALMPSADELRAYYAERYYQTGQGNYRKTYPQAERDYFDLKIAQKTFLLDRLRGGAGSGSFLDVGCGEGFALAWFKRHGWQVEGLDHSSAGIEAMHPDLLPHMRTGDLFALLDEKVSEGQHYDAVWLTHVLEHVRDPLGLFARLRGLVKQDGVLIVTVPNDGSTYQEMLLEEKFISRRFWIALPDHLAYFDGESLQRVAAETGWACREMVSDFPIDFFLLHEGSNYVEDSTKGPAAHRARIAMELFLGKQGHAVANEFYAALARVGLGRSLTCFMTPEPRGDS